MWRFGRVVELARRMDERREDSHHHHHYTHTPPPLSLSLSL